MAITTFSLNSPGDPVDPLNRANLALRNKIDLVRSRLRKIIGGGNARKARLRFGTRRAFGTLAFSSASGTVGGVINGVTITVSHDTSDLIDATALVAAINASSDVLVTDLVHASNYAGTVTLASAVPGDWVEILGVRFKGIGGTGNAVAADEFTTGGTDTQDAASLVVAINAHPIIGERVRATNASGVVTMRLYEATPDTLSLSSNDGTRMAVSAAVFATVATVMLSHLWKGVVGNQTTLAASGTGVTASGARLTGGVAGTTTIF